MWTVVFSLIVVLAMVAMFRYRLTAFIASFFILFSFATRTVSLAYVDLMGPLYADELNDYVGGASSMPLFALSIIIPLMSLAFAFRPSILRRFRTPVFPSARSNLMQEGFFLLSLLFVFLVYFDMLRKGTVPIFVGMDRLEYNNEIAGYFHSLLFDFGFLFSGIWGAMFVRSRLQGGDFDFRYLGLLIFVFVYLVLTGNRFSSFYSFISFFILPFSALVASSTTGRLLALNGNRVLWKKFLCSSNGLLAVFVLIALIIVFLLFNSVVNVRSYDDPMEFFFQRVFVQPVELWWSTWWRMGNGEAGDLLSGVNAVFFDSIDPSRNSSIQYLMILNLGVDRATELIELGQQYAGGYPEILFELMGYGAILVLFVFSLPMVALLRLHVRCLCEDRLLTSFMALYVYFGFCLLYMGGMLNFMIAWTFWVKMGILILVYFYEKPYYVPGRHLNPAGSSGLRERI